MELLQAGGVKVSGATAGGTQSSGGTKLCGGTKAELCTVPTPNIKLGVKQLEILFCLVIGIKEDKAIAEFIYWVKQLHYTPDSIKSIIKRLLHKFSLNTRDQLTQFVIINKIHTFIPHAFIKTGSFPLDDSISVIRG